MVNKMREEQQTSFLMIGGPVDGEIHAIPSDTRNWCIPVLGPLEPADFRYAPRSDAIPYTEHTYHKKLVCHDESMGRKELYVFVHQDILKQPDYNYQIMLKLLNHYRVIK